MPGAGLLRTTHQEQTSMLEQSVVAVLEGIPELPRELGAHAFQGAATDALEAKGFKVMREAKILDRGDGRIGKIDMVIDGVLAVELDHSRPRQKSVNKINAWDGPGLIYCRKTREVLEKKV